MTRKEFLQTAAGAVTATSLPSTASAATVKRGPKRGVSVYSYSDDIFKTVTLEDCFAAIDDLGTEGQDVGLEILANAHIEGYPNPSDAWIKRWFDLCAKYHLKPVEYGHWVDSKLWAEGPQPPWPLSTKESYDMLVLDIKLANRLGFTVGRTKLGVIDGELTPVKNWREFIKMALPVAEKYNFRMCPEIHSPTRLKSKMIDDYVDFIQKEKTTPWFGINVDFGVFQNRPRTTGTKKQEAFKVGSTVADMVPLLPYVHCCHAKFFEMNDEPIETTIPYPEIIAMLVKHNWDGYMMSEYEGADRSTGGAFTAVRKQHVMMKRLLGEA